MIYKNKSRWLRTNEWFLQRIYATLAEIAKPISKEQMVECMHRRSLYLLPVCMRSCRIQCTKVENHGATQNQRINQVITRDTNFEQFTAAFYSSNDFLFSKSDIPIQITLTMYKMRKQCVACGRWIMRISTTVHWPHFILYIINTDNSDIFNDKNDVIIRLLFFSANLCLHSAEHYFNVEYIFLFIFSIGTIRTCEPSLWNN